MEEGTNAEMQARIEALNNRLILWSDIYNGLRGNAEFEHRADFLWEHAIGEIYRGEMPRNAVFAIEVTADAGERLQSSYPQNVVKVREGQEEKFFSMLIHH